MGSQGVSSSAWLPMRKAWGGRRGVLGEGVGVEVGVEVGEVGVEGKVGVVEVEVEVGSNACTRRHACVAGG